MVNDNEHDALSSQELGERFDLLAADAREYAIFLVAPDGQILCWNPGAERLFGYRSNDVIGQHFSQFFSPEDVRSGQPEHELKSDRLTDMRPVCAGKCGRTALDFGVRLPSHHCLTKVSRSVPSPA